MVTLVLQTKGVLSVCCWLSGPLVGVLLVVTGVKMCAVGCTTGLKMVEPPIHVERPMLFGLGEQ